MNSTASSLSVGTEGHVTTLEIRRPPHNYLDRELVVELADRLEALDADPSCRVVVLMAEGRSFCAGANFGNQATRATSTPRAIYSQVARLFRTRKPIVAAVHGPAIGAGLGLALIADFRTTCDEARFSANFTRMGFHPGFGLSVTLPRIVGIQQAAMLFYTGRRINGREALDIGLADVLVEQSAVRQAALDLATEIASSAPLAITSVRATLRAGLADAVVAATDREATEQEQHFLTADFTEGLAAMTERRTPVFHGR